MKQNFLKNKKFYQNLSYKDLFKQYEMLDKKDTKNRELFYKMISDIQLVNISLFYLGFVPYSKSLSTKRYMKIHSMYLDSKHLNIKIKDFLSGKIKKINSEDYLKFTSLELDKASIAIKEFYLEEETRRTNKNISKIKEFVKKCDRYNKYKVFS